MKCRIRATNCCVDGTGCRALVFVPTRTHASLQTTLGDVVPYGRVWRTGANLATHLTTTAPISIAGIELAAGTYTLWTLPAQDRALLIVSRQTGQWGTGYSPAHDAGRAPLTAETLATVTDSFTIAVKPGILNAATLVLEWDRFRWTALIVAR